VNVLSICSDDELTSEEEAAEAAEIDSKCPVKVYSITDNLHTLSTSQLTLCSSWPGGMKDVYSACPLHSLTNQRSTDKAEIIWHNTIPDFTVLYNC